ncbi:MAG: hypothetical protein ACO1SX_06270 [Actinomycetota bacterium]
MSRRPTPAPDVRRPSKPARRSWTLVFLSALLAVAAVIAWPRPQVWYSLGDQYGRIRWVATRSEAAIEPPVAPDWVRDLRRRGIPWPTDLPLEPLGASFGAPSGNNRHVAWYLIQSSQPSKDLWHVDKTSVKITDAAGKERPWPGGSGAVLVDAERRLQYLYLGIDPELAGKGGRLHFRLARFEGPTTELVSVPF